MIYKTLKKLSSKFVTKFFYISMLFFTCSLIFRIEFKYNLISVAKASLSSHNSTQKLKKITDKQSIDNIMLLTLRAEKTYQPKLKFYNYANELCTLKDYRNNFLIIYIWASWCSDCLSELNKLVSLQNKLDDKDINDLIILPISIDFKDRQQIDTILQQHNLVNIKYYNDLDKEIMDIFKVHSLPTMVLINQQGYVLTTYNHPLAWEEEYMLKALLYIKNSNIIHTSS